MLTPGTISSTPRASSLTRYCSKTTTKWELRRLWSISAKLFSARSLFAVRPADRFQRLATFLQLLVQPRPREGPRPHFVGAEPWAWVHVGDVYRGLPCLQSLPGWIMACAVRLNPIAASCLMIES